MGKGGTPIACSTFRCNPRNSPSVVSANAYRRFTRYAFLRALFPTRNCRGDPNGDSANRKEASASAKMASAGAETTSLATGGTSTSAKRPPPLKPGASTGTLASSSTFTFKIGMTGKTVATSSVPAGPRALTALPHTMLVRIFSTIGGPLLRLFTIC